MNSRFIMPEEFSKEVVTIYSIRDLEKIEEYPTPTCGTPLEFMIRNFCEGFGINWFEYNKEFMQIFAYKTATTSQMNDNYDEKGYRYIYYKTPVLPKNIKMLTEGFSEESKIELTILGEDSHDSRYYFLALQEATSITYQETLKEANQISKRLNKNIIEIINKEIKSTLNIQDRY